MNETLILLVEDNPVDTRVITSTILESGCGYIVATVNNGVDAVDYLKKQGAYKSEKTPGLVILDLKIPRKNGLQVLEEVKNDTELSGVPVVVLTTSDAREDFMQAKKLGVEDFVVKSIKIDEFKANVLEICKKLKPAV